MNKDDVIGRHCSFFVHATTTFRETAWHPRADVYRTRTGWLVKLDVAGVRREDLEVLVVKGAVVVRGIRRDARLEEGCLSHLMEIPYSRFERVIELPLEPGAIVQADYSEGMLLVRIDTEIAR
jgi:HSP20 family protein